MIRGVENASKSAVLDYPKRGNRINGEGLNRVLAGRVRRRGRGSDDPAGLLWRERVCHCNRYTDSIKGIEGASRQRLGYSSVLLTNIGYLSDYCEAHRNPAWVGFSISSITVGSTAN